MDCRVKAFGSLLTKDVFQSDLSARNAAGARFCTDDIFGSYRPASGANETVESKDSRPFAKNAAVILIGFFSTISST